VALGPAVDAQKLSGFSAAAHEHAAARYRAARDAALRPVAAWLISQHATLGVKRFALVSCGDTDTVAAEAVMHLARLAAGDGLKLIVVDADAKKRLLGPLFGLSGAKGLNDLIAGDAAFSDVIVRDTGSAAHVLPAGLADTGARTPAMRERMNTLLDALEHAYDVVLVHVGAATGAELAAGGPVAGCKGAVLFAPTTRGADAGAILAHLHRLGARSTRLVKVGDPSGKQDRDASARMAVNA